MPAAAHLTNPRSACRWLLLVGGAMVISGCQSSPHNDVYIDKLTSEIRFLEDQLYEIDYENKLLRERLRRAGRATPAPLKRESLFGQNSRDDRGDRSAASSAGEDDGFEEIDLDLGVQIGSLEEIEGPGEISVPDGMGGAGGLEGSRRADDNLPAPPAQLGQPKLDAPEISLPEDTLIPPDLTPPEINLGVPAPPGGASAQPKVPPGKIVLPTTTNMLYPQATARPKRLEIDLALTTSIDRDKDGKPDAMKLAVRAFDDRNNTVPLASGLPIAVLDPEQREPEARLGRWDFDAAKVSEARQDVHGINIIGLVVDWRGKRPKGDSVMVFARTDQPIDRRLQCNAVVKLGASKVAESWSPRGLEKR